MTLISQYSFNEGSGSTAFDSSGNSYNLAASNSISSWTTGKSSSGAQQEFSGVLGPDVRLNAWTVMAWVKIPAIPTDYAGLVIQDSGTVGIAYYLEVDNTGHISIWTNTAPVTSVSVLPLNTWTHIAITFGASGNSSIYINGSLDANGPYGYGVNFGASGQTSYVATTTAHDAVGFDGVMDDLRLFDAELTSGEVTTWMNTPASPPGLLLASYGFNEGSGATTTDLTGNGYNLTTDGSGWVSGGRTGSGGKGLFSGVMGPAVVQQDWTVMAWVKRNSVVATYGAVLSNNSNFYLELWHSGDRVECYSGASGHPSSGDGAVPTNIWTHVAVTREAGGTSNLYIDGVSTATGAGGAVNFGAGTWYIGGASANPSYILDGTVDDVRIFSGVVSSSEITTWMNTPIGASATLLAAYAFNETDGATTTADWSGHGVTAAVNGASFTDGALPNTRAITFTSTGQSVEIPRTKTEPALIGVVAMCWAKGPVDMDYLIKARALGGSTRIGVGPNWRARWKDDLHYTDGGSGVDTSTWHHYCVVDTDTEWVAYIDGVVYDGGSRVLDPTSPGIWENFVWAIGQEASGGLGDSRAGQTVSDVRIFQGEMTQVEVQTWMNTPVMPQGRKFRLGSGPKPIKLGSIEKFFRF